MSFERSKTRKGFTLIELLIVIAIILILIAIALPNFLEAQIRAKVVSAKAHLRTIQTALAAYSTDYPNDFKNPGRPQDRYGPYPPQRVRRPQQPDMECNDQWDPGCFNILSTPVPYLKEASAVFDPFQAPSIIRSSQFPQNDDISKRPFAYQSPGRSGNRNRFDFWSPQNPHRRNPHFSSTYWVYSVGPDNCAQADNGWRACWGAGFSSSPGRRQYWEYSATNGTKSDGDLHLLQGIGIVN